MGLLSWLMGGGCDSVTPDEVRDMKKAGQSALLMVDVRTPGEYATRKIDGAKHIPVQELGNRYKEIPMDKDVVVYCQNGVRSLYACRFLKNLGYNRVKNMSGGISRW